MLTVKFAGLIFSTPFVATAGTAGYGHDLKKISSSQTFDAFGAIVTKTVTPQPWKGANFPRVCETEAGLINAIGLQNDGIDALIETHLPALEGLKQKIIVSLAANTTSEFVAMVERLSTIERVDAIELNVSCPNSDYGGKSFASDHRLLKELVPACVNVKKKKPLIVKLSPHVNSIAETAKLIETCQADALSVANTIRGLKIDIVKEKSMLANGVGGYSGIGIKPICLAMVYEAAQVVEIPIIGIGGVFSGSDAAEYLLAGASLVGIGSATMVSTRSGYKIKKELVKILKKKKLDAIQLKGRLTEH